MSELEGGTVTKRPYVRRTGIDPSPEPMLKTEIDPPSPIVNPQASPEEVIAAFQAYMREHGLPTTEAGRAPAAEADAVPPGYVRCRVMKKGDRRIFTGETMMLESEKFPTYRKGDLIDLPRDTAEIYEDDKGWVEII